MGEDPDDVQGALLAVFVECRDCGTAVLTKVHFAPDGQPYVKPVGCRDHGG